MIAKLITNETNKKLGNNILNIDNSRSKNRKQHNSITNSCVSDNQFNHKLDNGILTKYIGQKKVHPHLSANGASCTENDLNYITSLKKVTSLNSQKKSTSSTSNQQPQQPSSSSKKTFQESSPQTVERKPQLNQQQSSSNLKQLSSSLSKNQLSEQQVELKKERRSLKKFFRFSSSANKQSTTSQSNLNENNSRSSLRSASNLNQDRVVDSLIVNDLVDKTRLSNSNFTVPVSIESAKTTNHLKTTSTNCKSRTDETTSFLIQHNSNQDKKLVNSFHHPKNHKTSTANNSPNNSQNSQQSIHLKEANSLNSTASSILPSSQSSSFLLNTNNNNYSLTKNQNILSTSSKKNQQLLPTQTTKAISTSDNHQNYQFNLPRTSFDSASSSDQHQITKTISSSTNKNNNQDQSIKLKSSNCLNCGDHLNLSTSKNSMSNGSNVAAAAAAMQNADAYLSQLSAQQLNQLIMDQAFLPQNNTSNSTHSNSLSNHGNGTNNNNDSESSEQFRRLLCRKCRPNRTGIVQHSHNSNSKFARNLHASAMHHPRNGWNALKEYSKGSIKRLKRHQKRLTNYARAMRKQYNHHHNSASSGNGGGGGNLTSGDLSDNAHHQAALANMMLNAMNSNKLNNLSSPNFCKECYLEKMLSHQQQQNNSNGLTINDYQQQASNKNPVCLGCYNNALSMMNTPPANNFDLPQKMSPFKNDGADFVDSAYIDRFWDVDQWRNKLRKERLRKKERNVLMVVSSIAIIVFIGISYFGTILFLRLTRLQNEE